MKNEKKPLHVRGPCPHDIKGWLEALDSMNQ